MADSNQQLFDASKQLVSGLLSQKAQQSGQMSVDTSGSPADVSAQDIAGSQTPAEASKKSPLQQMSENLQKLGTGRPQSPPIRPLNIQANVRASGPNVRPNSKQKPTLSDYDYLDQSASTEAKNIVPPPYTPSGNSS